IRAAQPKGPYFIGGYFFGGAVAFEMARQLHAPRQPTGILAVFDTEAPRAQPVEALPWSRNFSFWLLVFFFLRNPSGVAVSALAKMRRLSIQMLAKAIPPLRLPAPARQIEDDVDMPRHWPERYRRVIEAHYKALLAYKPAPFAGTAALFRTKAQPLLRAHADNGWGRLVLAGADVYPIAGRHMNFLQEPYVRSVATQLRIALEKSRNRAGIRSQPLARVAAGRNAVEPTYSSSESFHASARR